MSVFKNKKLLIKSLLLFILMNIALYSFLQFFHSAILFKKSQYLISGYHYIQDPRMKNKPFNLVSALAPYDAQWYLHNAVEGYLKNPKVLEEKMSYNFFPFLTFSIKFFYLFIPNIELAAFVLSNTLLLLNFFSLYYVITKWYSEKLAIKTIFLLFLFPFSIFFRSYYTEMLKLFFFIWFSYFLINKRFFWAATCLSLINITNGIVLILNPIFYWYLIQAVMQKKEYWAKAVIAICISFIPLIAWCIFCYLHTGDFFYFYKTRFWWWRPQIPIVWNIQQIFLFPWLHPFGMYSTKTDVLAVVLSGIILIKSRKLLHPTLWVVTCGLWIMPLLVQDTISFSRLQIVLFPLFLFLAHSLQKKYYFAVLAFFTILLGIYSLFFVNWYWIE